MKSKHWKVHGSSYPLKGPWLRVRADECETPSGARLGPYFVVEAPDWVHMVVFDRQQRVLLVRLYRHGNASVNLEIPAGTMEAGDASPEAAARRELLEETGCTARTFIPVAHFTPNSARYNNTVHCFAVLDAERTAEPTPEVTEDISVEWVTVTELLQRIDEGAFRQALHVAAVYRALRHLGLLELRAEAGDA